MRSRGSKRADVKKYAPKVHWFDVPEEYGATHLDNVEAIFAPVIGSPWNIETKRRIARLWGRFRDLRDPVAPVRVWLSNAETILVWPGRYRFWDSTLD